MHITVLGASGRVGQLVVTKALARGMTVTAFGHVSRPDFAESASLQFVQGDARNSSDLVRAIHGADAVISCLGSWHTQSKDILSTCMEHLLPLLQKHGPRRLVTLTGCDARWRNDQPDVFFQLSHKLFSVYAPKILEDSEKHLRLLEQSSLDWTCLRSPIMTDEDSPPFAVQLKRPPLWATIPRANVANALLNLARSKDFIQQAPFIVKK